MLFNKLKISLVITWGISVLMFLAIVSCVDEIPGYGANGIEEGEVNVNLEAAFSPFTEAVLSRSAEIPGNAMKDLSDLCIIAYDSDGNLISDIGDYHFPMEIAFNEDEVKDEDRVDSDASNGTTAEVSTKCLKKTIKLPTGRYTLIAVANLGEYTRNADGSVTTVKSTMDALAAGGKYSGQYKTLDALRSMTVSWNLDNDADNREMLGYFADPSASAPYSGSQFPSVLIDRDGKPLRAWLRRCASKVTIDFDGSDLRENVKVYLKEARIYDIPKTCTLGFGRGSDVQVSYNNAAGKDGIYTSDEKKLVNTIPYGTDEDYKNWPAITKGTPYGAYINEDGNVIDAFDYASLHSQSAPSLFFYENMQGDAPYDKFQVADLDNGGVQNADIEKDGVPYGTYVEVVAYYYSAATASVAQGEIKYRFMLGKDVKRDCNAERNYHYKLTLKLHGNANDFDWHIDYKDKKGFDIPNPWYVSYLYNHDAILPFKYTPPVEGAEVIRLEAEIIENPWYPANGEVPDGEQSAPFTDSRNKDNGNGFLSLKKTEDVVVTPEMSGYQPSDYLNNTAFKYTDVKLASMNNNYYTGKVGGVDRSKRTYYFDGTEDSSRDDEREAYSYQKEGDKYTFNIPLFTRAKVLIKQTGYSGNNPYVGYERHARVKFTAYYKTKSGEVKHESDTTTVIQVRRIVNPKGVYRRAGNNQDFNVTLMRLPGDDKDEFETFKSDGPWMAEIIGDKNFITLDGKQIVTGATKTDIKFQIRFNKLNTKDTPTKNAVIRVRYHNYTCTHLIFVRQGYDAQALYKSGKNMVGKVAVDGQPAAEWSTFNMISHSVPTSDPRDEGSMFKFGNKWYGIDSSCNTYTDADGNPISGFPDDDQFAALPVYTVDGAGNVEAGEKVWNTFHPTSAGFTGDNAMGGDSMQVASARDFEQLYLTPNIQFGYGVLYADGATTTQPLVNDAYGWYRADESANKNSKGMRGMFAYYWDRNNPADTYNARNVFFPIGRSGYGHRRNAKNGELRYCSGRTAYADLFVPVAPLFCHLYRRPGAIYWARETSDYIDWSETYQSDKMYALDINYFSFDVNGITSGNVGYGEDACFVRVVKK